jgi:amidophosphoribosyltransferase
MGVLGVYGVPNASTYLYYGLHNIQHRGQEGAGIVTFDDKGQPDRHRGLGLLSEVFKEGHVHGLEGSIGIGSVKYANARKGGLDNVDPILFYQSKGDFAVACDGNIINARQLELLLEKRGIIFQTATDSELFAHLIK